MSMKLILVTGATGQQGGAVARHLLKETGFAVRALTRDAAKRSSRALAQAGEEMTRMYRWFQDVGYHVDIPALRREHEFLTLEQVLRRQEWRAAESRKAT